MNSRPVCGTIRHRLVDGLFANHVANTKTTRLAIPATSVSSRKLRANTGPVRGSIEQRLVNELFAKNVAILHARPDIAKHAAPAETRLARKQEKEVIALMKYNH